MQRILNRHLFWALAIFSLGWLMPFGSASFASALGEGDKHPAGSSVHFPHFYLPLSEEWRSYYCMSVIRFTEAKGAEGYSERISFLLESVGLLERAADLAPGPEDSALQLPIAQIYKELYRSTGDPIFAEAALKGLDHALEIYPENRAAGLERERWMKVVNPLELGELSKV